MKSEHRFTMGVAVFLASLAGWASAQISPPPYIGRNGEHILYLSNPLMNYSVSDFGWSDTWMTPPQITVQLLADTLSGDDAGNLHYRINNAQMAGNGWLTPTLDAGALTPSRDTGSPWVVVTPVHLTAGTIASSSTIAQPRDGLQITIVTMLTGPNSLTQTYDVRNTGANTITNLDFADYINFHPMSSQAPYNTWGHATVAGGSAYFFFVPDAGHPFAQPPYLTDGYMQGNRLPDATALGDGPLVGVNPVIPMVEGENWNGVTGPIGPNDVAAALMFTTAQLNPGDHVVYTINKGFGPAPAIAVPEPATLLLLTVTSALALLRRKTRRA